LTDEKWDTKGFLLSEEKNSNYFAPFEGGKHFI
jgi:hypothetical protein